MRLDLDRSTWMRVRFGDVVHQVKTSVDPGSSGLERYVAGQHMDTNELAIRRWGQIGDGYLGPAFHRAFKSGQVLYGSRRTYLRKVAFAEFDGVCANTTFVAEVADAEKLLPELLPFVMTTDAFHRHSISQSKGSVNPYINWSDLAWFQFDLPTSRGEQSRIADLLWACQKEFLSAKRVADAAHALVSTKIASDLSSMGDDLVDFKDIWSRTPESGCSEAPTAESTGHYALSLASLTDDGFRVEMTKDVRLTPGMKAAILSRGDLLISRANTLEAVGRCAVYPLDTADVSFPDTMMRLHVRHDRVLPEYLALVLSSPMGRHHVRRTAAGTNSSMLKINRKSLGAFQLPLPSKEVQAELLARASTWRRPQIAAEVAAKSTSVLRRELQEKLLGGSNGL